MTNNSTGRSTDDTTTESSGGAQRTPSFSLAGITVLSLAEQYPGPYASMLLAEMGANVIMVERPGGGDPARQFPVFFEAINRNKRSIALDLKSDAGRRAFSRLASTADILLEGFRPGVAERLSVDYDSIRSVKPDIVYISISGFGQNGPWRLHPGHDLTYQSLAGFLHDQPICTTEGGDGSLVTPVGDLATGTFAVIAALSGLLGRNQTGRGTYVDLSITDCLLSFSTAQLFSEANGMPRPGIPPREPAYGLFRTLDGRFIGLGVAHEDPFWDSLCRTLGLDRHVGLRADARTTRYTELREAIADRFASKTSREWEELLVRSNIAFAPVLSPSEVLSHPQINARNLTYRLEADGGNPARTHVRQPLGLEPSVRRHAPKLGEHTETILREAGFSNSEIDGLLEGSAVGSPS